MITTDMFTADNLAQEIVRAAQAEAAQHKHGAVATSHASASEQESGELVTLNACQVLLQCLQQVVHSQQHASDVATSMTLLNGDVKETNCDCITVGEKPLDDSSSCWKLWNSVG